MQTDAHKSEHQRITELETLTSDLVADVGGLQESFPATRFDPGLQPCVVHNYSFPAGMLASPPAPIRAPRFEFKDCDSYEIYRNPAGDPVRTKDVRLVFGATVMAGAGTQAEVFAAPTAAPGAALPVAPPAGGVARIWATTLENGLAQPVSVDAGNSIYIHYSRPTDRTTARVIEWDVN